MRVSDYGNDFCLLPTLGQGLKVSEIMFQDYCYNWVYASMGCVMSLKVNKCVYLELYSKATF